MGKLLAPIFIGGMFKSGTSLLRAMLGRHSAISAGLETAWFELKWNADLGRGGEALADYVSRTAGFYDEDPDVAKKMAAESPDPETFIDQLLGAKARRDGSRRWAEKTPGNVRQAARIFRHWPDARLIHIIRDPRDTFASLRQAGKWSTVHDFASRWCDAFGAWEESKNSGLVTADNSLEIRYESLAREPVRIMAGVLDFLDERWEPAAAEHPGETRDYFKVLNATGKASSTLARLAEPMSISRIGIWQETLTAKEMSAAEAFANERGLADVYQRCFAEAQP